MFLRRLSSFKSSFPPCSHLAVSQAGFRSSSASSSSSVFLPQFFPALLPWWPVQGFPPWPPQLTRHHPSAHQVITGRPSHPLIPGSFGVGSRPFSTSEGRMMERRDRDREPPYKRRKSSEERKGRPKELESRTDSGLRPNPRLRDGSGEKGKNGAVRADSGGSSERTKSGSKDSTSRDGSPRSHPAGSRSHILRAEQDSGHKPNPWFRDRGPQEQGGLPRNSRGPAGQPRDRSTDGGQRSEPHSNAQRKNLWQVGGASWQPPPPGTSPPVNPLQRHWESCSSDLQPLGGGSTVFDFSVMSYNILSQELLQDNAYLYRHCNSAFLPWEYRLPNLLTEIQQHDADILCLQEVQQDHYQNQIKPALQALGYHCEYKKRTGRKPDGCVISFKTCRFSLLSSNPVEFFRPGDALLDRDNVGLVVLLRPSSDRTDPSSVICVGNTHLLYNPRRGDVKLAQLAILLAEISRLSRLPDGSTSPVVLCGDFNSTPWSPLYSFLTSGGLDYRGMQIGMVSGQEDSPRGQRLLTSPIWSHSLGISHRCQYDEPAAAEAPPTSPTAVEGAISLLTVHDLTSKAAVAVHRSRLEHGLKLQSSYCHQLMPDGRPEVTTCHSRTAMTVDYILYSPDFLMPSMRGGRGLRLLSRLSLVGQPELEEVNGLPNQHHSSDHLPLLTHFRLQH